MGWTLLSPTWILEDREMLEVQVVLGSKPTEVPCHIFHDGLTESRKPAPGPEFARRRAFTHYVYMGWVLLSATWISEDKEMLEVPEV